MDMTTMETATIGGIVLVPLIIGLVAMCRQIPGFPAWLAPIVALGLGLAMAVGYEAVSDTHTGQEWFTAVLLGLALGLSASGLYSGTREMVKTMRHQ